MNTFFDEFENEASMKLTENGSLSYSTSASSLLDLFALGGAYRTRTDEEVVQLFAKAYYKDRPLAVACLFYLRDIRGGQGERRFFRVVFDKMYPQFLADFGVSATTKLLSLFATYGRWDDLVYLVPKSKAATTLLCEQYAKDLAYLKAGEIEKLSLLGKWMPSIGTSSADTVTKAKYLANYMRIPYKAYRKNLSALRAALKVVERDMTANRWEEIVYEHVPSKAMLKYQKAFSKHDENRYSKYRDDVISGKTKVNASVTYPHEIVAKILDNNISPKDADMLWYSLPDYVSESKAIAVVDVSGSMLSGTPMPMSVSIALGIYFAERNTGAFNGKYITFSESPQVISVDSKKSDITGKVKYVESTAVAYNTNLNKVFDVFLKAAQKPDVRKEDIPNTLVLISDMEFDRALSNQTNFQAAKSMFQAAGVEMPSVVFWNVSARNDTLPVTKNEQGVTLVSGFSPATFKFVMNGSTPMELMLEVLNSYRYKPVVDALQ